VAAGFSFQLVSLEGSPYILAKPLIFLIFPVKKQVEPKPFNPAATSIFRNLP